MIIYDPMWQTMKNKGISGYALRERYGISSSTLQRLKKNMPVSTNTLNDICVILDCELHEVAQFKKED